MATQQGGFARPSCARRNTDALLENGCEPMPAAPRASLRRWASICGGAPHRRALCARDAPICAAFQRRLVASVSRRASRASDTSRRRRDALACAQKSPRRHKTGRSVAVRLAWRLASLRARRTPYVVCGERTGARRVAVVAAAELTTPLSRQEGRRGRAGGRCRGAGRRLRAGGAQQHGPRGQAGAGLRLQRLVRGRPRESQPPPRAAGDARRLRPLPALAPRVGSDGRRGAAAVARAAAACARRVCAFRVSLAPPRVLRRASQALRLLFGRRQGAQGRGPAPQRVPHRLLRRSQCAPARAGRAAFDVRTRNAPPAPARRAILAHAAPRARISRP